MESIVTMRELRQ